MSGAATCSAPHREALELVFSKLQDCPLDEDDFDLLYQELDDVVREGCLACLRFARENRIMDQYWASWDDACAMAAEYGHWECVKYLHEICGCPLSASVSLWAVGNLEILKYLREHGCPYDECTVSAAIGDGDLESLKYLLDDWCLEEYVVTQAVEEMMHSCLELNSIPERCDFNQFKCLEYIYETLGWDYHKCYFMSELKLRWAIEPIRLAMTTLDEVKECMIDGSYKTIADGLMHAYRNFNAQIRTPREE